MPLPAIIGASALGTAIGGFITTVTTLVVLNQVKRVLIVVALMTIIYVATTNFFNVVVSAIEGVWSGIPSGLNGLGYLLPSNTGECLSAIFAVHTACLIYTLTFKAVKLQMNLA
jgi:hypothetical protein